MIREMKLAVENVGLIGARILKLGRPSDAIVRERGLHAVGLVYFLTLRFDLWLGEVWGFLYLVGLIGISY